MAVYLCTEFSTVGGCEQQAATPEQIALVEGQLESATLAPFIDSFYFETQEEAYANFQEQFAGTTAAELVSPEFLAPAFWVNLVDVDQSQILVDALGGLAGVESIEDERALPRRRLRHPQRLEHHGRRHRLPHARRGRAAHTRRRSG